MARFAKRTNWDVQVNEITKLVQSLRHDGITICDLTISNPTQAEFAYLNESLLNRFNNAQMLKYDPDSLGPSLTRAAICDYYASKQVQLSPDQVVITAGSSEAYSHIFRLIANPGDKILVPVPGYPLLQQLAELHDLNVVPYEVRFQNGSWRINQETLQNIENACLMFLMNPSNPCGNFVSKDEIFFVQEFCQSRNIALVVDEVFHDYALEIYHTPSSFAAYSNVLTFTVSGISKILGLPGMKVGWMVVTGPKNESAEAISKLELINDAYLSAATPQLLSLPYWLTLRSRIQEEITSRIKLNLEWLKTELNRSNALNILPVQAGWYAILELPDSVDDLEFTLELLKNDHVLIHPGYLFDFKESNKIVMSLLGKEADFQSGVRKLTKKAND